MKKGQQKRAKVLTFHTSDWLARQQAMARLNTLLVELDQVQAWVKALHEEEQRLAPLLQPCLAVEARNDAKIGKPMEIVCRQLSLVKRDRN